mgnify:CR=1 FL=1
MNLVSSLHTRSPSWILVGSISKIIPISELPVDIALFRGADHRGPLTGGLEFLNELAGGPETP